MQIQQGDVTLERLDRLPEGASEVTPKARGIVLAEGEHTGHAHCIVKHKDVAWMYEKDGVLYVKALDTVTIEHEEHKPVTVPAGVWKIGIVREFDHFAQMERQVRD